MLDLKIEAKVANLPSMTVVAAVKVADGAVLGTDSMTHAVRADVRKSYTNAPKLFQIGDLPAGVMFFGQGTLSDRSVTGLVRDFCDEMTEGAALDEIAVRLHKFARERYHTEFGSTPPEDRPTFGAFLAGYTTGEAYAEAYEFSLPSDRAPILVWDRAGAEGNAVWRGVTGPLTRLFVGYDPRIRARLQREGLSGRGIERTLADLQSPISAWGMPLIDAVGYVQFMLETTIGMSQLEPDPAPCSGPLQIVAIDPDGGFRWVRRLVGWKGDEEG